MILSASRPLRAPFPRILLRYDASNEFGLFYSGKLDPLFPFSFPVESSSLQSRAGLSTVSENSGLSSRRYRDGGSFLG